MFKMTRTKTPYLCVATGMGLYLLSTWAQRAFFESAPADGLTLLEISQSAKSHLFLVGFFGLLMSPLPLIVAILMEGDGSKKIGSASLLSMAILLSMLVNCMLKTNNLMPLAWALGIVSLVVFPVLVKHWVLSKKTFGH